MTLKPEICFTFQPLPTKSSDISNRPLPATPVEERERKSKKTRKTSPKGHKSGESNRRSWIFGSIRSEKSDESGRLSPHASTSNGTPVVNGQDASSRPVSVQYKNDGSPVHSRSDSDPVDGGELYAGPPTPKRYDSLRKLDPNGVPIEEDEQLKQANWYQAGIPREIALEILSQQEIGSFIVRDSTSHQGCYALSVKVPKFDNPTGISHYLIQPTRNGVRLKGLDKEWPNMTALVTHHTVMPEMLPCTLRLPRNANNPAFNEVDRDDKDEDEDYQKLADCRTMMADLKM